MACASVQSKSSASRKPLFDKLCMSGADSALLGQSCKSFLENPKKNPLTGKAIIQGKDVHKFFTELCATKPTKRASSAIPKSPKAPKAPKAPKPRHSSASSATQTKASKASKASAPAQSTQATQSHQVTNAQVALEEMIEQKIETYLSALDQYYTKRWGAGSAPKDAISPVNWFTHVRNVESHISREYDMWVTSGNEPVREFVSQHIEPSSVPHHASINAYVTDLYEAAQAFFNIHSLMHLDDLDAIFKAVKDKHMAQLSQYPSVHEERLQRKRFVQQVEKVELEFKHVFTTDKDKKDVSWVKTEFNSILTQSDSRLAKFAERAFNHALEIAIQKGFITMSDLEQSFHVGRRRLF